MPFLQFTNFFNQKTWFASISDFFLQKKNTDLTNLAFCLSILEKFSENFVSDVLSFYDFGWLWLKSTSLTICDRFQFRNAILQILNVSY